MLAMWFCRDISKIIPPYRMMREEDVRHVNRGNQKLSNMKYLVKQVIRSARIANKYDLVVQNWYPRKVMYLYLGVSDLFAFPCLSIDKRRRYKTISWNTTKLQSKITQKW